MPGVEVSTSIERSIAMLSQDIDSLSHTLKASGNRDVDSYRQTGLIDSMKQQRRELRSKLLITRLLPTKSRQ